MANQVFKAFFNASESTNINKVYNNDEMIFIISLKRMASNRYIFQGYKNDQGVDIPAVSVYLKSDPSKSDMFNTTTLQFRKFVCEALQQGGQKCGPATIFVGDRDNISDNVSGLYLPYDADNLKIIISKSIYDIKEVDDTDGTKHLQYSPITSITSSYLDGQLRERHKYVGKVITNEYLKGYMSIPEDTLMDSEEAQRIFSPYILNSNEYVQQSSTSIKEKKSTKVEFLF